MAISRQLLLKIDFQSCSNNMIEKFLEKFLGIDDAGLYSLLLRVSFTALPLVLQLGVVSNDGDDDEVV
jgi:hypothetical protein